jgi:hypothetical protein
MKRLFGKIKELHRLNIEFDKTQLGKAFWEFWDFSVLFMVLVWVMILILNKGD